MEGGPCKSEASDILRNVKHGESRGRLDVEGESCQPLTKRAWTEMRIEGPLTTAASCLLIGQKDFGRVGTKLLLLKLFTDLASA